MYYESARNIESALYTSYEDTCKTLHGNLALNDQELICCFCSYQGIQTAS